MTMYKEDVERNNLEVFVNKYLSPSEIDAWYSTHSGRRFMTFVGAALVIFNFVDGKAEIQNRLTCREIKVHPRNGLSSVWENEVSGKLITVSHTPVEIADTCFLHHTFESSVSYHRLNGPGYGTSFSMVYRSKNNPFKVREEKVDYVIENSAFNKFFGV